MKQIIQNLGSGETRLIETPRPASNSGSLIIDTRCSLISVGTERMLVDFGKSSMLSKARQQPDKVKQVLNKVKTDGLATTVDAVRSKLAQPIPLGYSNVGVVGNVGKGVNGFRVGDRVLSNGSHAETVRVSQNLCAKIPDNVSNDTAAFTVVASIGLQGVRLVGPTIGENIVVMGTGLIGLLTVQILLANGCRVLAMDYDAEKLALAQQWGAEICVLGDGIDSVAAGMAFSGGQGVDAVLITASTKSSDPVSHAAKMSRKRGRIVLVGVTGLELTRDDFYEKELSFQVSCSYGPGRYDPLYEDANQDYPYGFVRWTEQRNFEAVLQLMSEGKIDVSQMISKSLAFDEAPDAFQSLNEDKSLLGVLLQYGSKDENRQATSISKTMPSAQAASAVKVAVVGAGNYASRVLIPALKKTSATLGPIITSQGLSGAIVAEKFEFEAAGTDLGDIVNDESVNSAIIVTQHNSHAPLAAQMLEAGKHVFVEKPLAINRHQLDVVEQAYQKAENSPHIMVGFNRRFAPLIVKMKELADKNTGPKSLIMTMNAGAIPANTWIQDSERGGGRIIGEACHFIDLMRFLVGHKVTEVKAQRMGDNDYEDIVEDKAMILLRFADGSHGVIHYLANGAASFPKERIELFASGGILQLDNFKSLRGFDWPGFKKMGGIKQDKGQSACIAAFCEALATGKQCPIPPDEIFEVAHVTLDAAEQLES